MWHVGKKPLEKDASGGDMSIEESARNQKI